MMKRYKITYWLASNIKVTYVEADCPAEALVVFYLHNACDDVIEVKEDVEL